MNGPFHARVCPACGERQSGLRCVRDGSITVERAYNEPRAALPLESGTELDGRYVIGAAIGRGAFGAVYAAEQLSTGQRVAVKALLATPHGGRRLAEERFRKEARVLAKLRHPSTVRLFDVGVTGSGNPYFAMELVEGPNLEQVMASRKAAGERFTEAEIIDIVVPVLGSLAEAHALGLVHRDLKPANIMLSSVADDGLVVKVLDFGVVRTEDSDLTGRASGLGTPRYMSPEQCRAEGVDGRSDLYSVGCILYEALTGEVPFAGANAIETMYAHMMHPIPTLASRGVTVSAGMAEVLERALAKSAADRFATAAEMRAALDSLRRGHWRDQPSTSLLAVFRDDVEFDESGASVFVSQQITTAVPRQGTSSAEVPKGLRDTPLESELVVERDPAERSLPRIDDAMLEAGAAPTPAEDAGSTREEDLTSGSQGLVRLPSPRVLEAAIAARNRALEARKHARSDADTRVEFDDERRRSVQVAPPSRDDVSGRGRKPLGSSTIMGTGVPHRRKGDDDA